MSKWEQFKPESGKNPFKEASKGEIKAGVMSTSPENQKMREMKKGEAPLEGISETEIHQKVEGALAEKNKENKALKLGEARIGASAEDIQAALDKLNEAYANPLEELAAKTNVEDKKANKKPAPSPEARP